MAGTGASVVVDRSARVRVPNHVVYRPFAAETVVLNLETGLYHGLNPSAATMLAALERSASVGDALEWLAGHFGLPASELESDLIEFCGDLHGRGLIEVVDADGAS